MPFTAGDVVAQKTTASFAVSVKELFSGLLCGYPVAIFSDNQVKDANLFIKYLAKWQVTRLNIVPSQLHMLVDNHASAFSALTDLRYIVTAGEPLTYKLLDKVMTLCPKVAFYNNYGCTELNDVTYYNVTEHHGNSVTRDSFVPIGYAIQNTKLYILDRHRNPVALGMSGELYVESMGLPRGYINQPEMTAERFIVNPFSPEANSYLFNTGDVVRYLSDGKLEYLHRWDFQIKIRGFRIDVRQIEYCLGQFPDIKTPIVHGWKPENIDEGADTSVLVAYYLTDNKTLDESLIKRFLSEQLPSYMVPDFFVALDKFPYLPNGKLNRRSLPAPTLTVIANINGEMPNTETELLLANIWADVLKIPLDTIDRNVNFFDLGGNSLAAMYLVKKIESTFYFVLALNEIFANQNIEAIAKSIDDKKLILLNGLMSIPTLSLSKNTAAVLSSEQCSYSFIKKTLTALTSSQLSQVEQFTLKNEVKLSTTYFNSNTLNHYDDGYSGKKFPAFNSQLLYLTIKDEIGHEVIADIMAVDHKINYAILCKTVRMLIQEIDSLRTYFEYTNEWLQIISDEAFNDGVVLYKDMSMVAEEDYLFSCDQECVRLSKALDITKPFLFRVVAFDGGNSKKDKVAFIFHHLIFDGISPQIILPRIFALYQYCMDEISSLVPFESKSVYEYFRWFSNRLDVKGVQQRLSHWLEHDKWHNSDAYLDRRFFIEPCKVKEKESLKLKHYEFQTIEVPMEATLNALDYFNEYDDVTPGEGIMMLILRALMLESESGFLPLWVVDGGRDDIDGVDASGMVGYLSIHVILGLNIDKGLSLNEWFLSLKEQINRAQIGFHDFSSAYYNNFNSSILSDEEINKIKSIPHPNLYFNFMGINDGEGHSKMLKCLSEPQSLNNVFFSGLHFTSMIQKNKLYITVFHSKKLYEKNVIDHMTDNILKQFSLL
jgi:acyl carrier protein